MQNNKIVDFIKMRKIWISVYAVIIVAAIIVLAVFGANLSIDFKGGTVLNYSFKDNIDLDKAEEVIEAAVGQKVSVSENENFISKAKSLVVTLPSVKVGVTEDTKSEILKTLNANLAANKIALKSDDNSKDNNTLIIPENYEYKSIKWRN